VLPFIVTWCRRAEELSAADAARNLALVMLMREKAVAATEPYDFLITPTSPITAYAAEEATPGDDPFKPFEQHRLHGAVQHVGTAGRLDLCGLRYGRNADRIADRWASLRRYRRAPNGERL
jgi:hypothetical protein